MVTIVKVTSVDDPLFKPCFDLSAKVFSNATQGHKSFIISVWIERLENNGVIFAVLDETRKVCSFVFAHPKSIKDYTALPEKISNPLHVFLAGTDESMRGKGYFSILMAKVRQHSLDNNFDAITLNTNKDKFPFMHSWCAKNGTQVSLCEEKVTFVMK
eukprot:TRINITY_DN127_c0_g1_i4.p1 TRINITY_DN127_c0_g1~~TRINITY_DN127_c0_g1_i4.p1  ORF type:complete len:158 (+),score=26.93 TRINITY_DN127_c0_g1_i4:232-705(+)